MKYLKKFNESLWDVISDNEFFSKIEGNIKAIPFTNSEYLQIEKIVSTLNGEYSMKFAPNASIDNTIIDILDPSYEIILEIIKSDDEWFFIISNNNSDEERVLKCDQWDGLIECIKDCINKL